MAIPKLILSKPRNPHDVRECIAYYRVSTRKQGDSGLGLEAQQEAVQRCCRLHNLALSKEFTEVESGKRDDRPILAEAISTAKSRRAVLIVAKLDRLSRSSYFTSMLMESGLEFICADMPGANKFTIHILAAVAEHERDLISQRTREALRAKMARGYLHGAANPNHYGSEDLRKEAMERLAKAAEKGRKNYQKRLDRNNAYAMTRAWALRQRGFTLQQIADKLNEKGECTIQNARWHPETVRRLIKRYETKHCVGDVASEREQHA